MNYVAQFFILEKKSTEVLLSNEYRVQQNLPLIKNLDGFNIKGKLAK